MARGKAVLPLTYPPPPTFTIPPPRRVPPALTQPTRCRALAAWDDCPLHFPFIHGALQLSSKVCNSTFESLSRDVECSLTLLFSYFSGELLSESITITIHLSHP